MSRRASYDALIDDDDIHEADITVGMRLRGSVVTKVKVEVTETEEKYKLRKFLTLLSGIQIISLYIKPKSEGLSDLERAGEVSLDPMELEKFKNEHQKDDSDARAKARAMLKQRMSSPAVLASPKKEPKWNITVQTPDDVMIELRVKPTATICDIMEKVREKKGIPVEQQRLVFKGKSLDDPQSNLKDNNISDGSTLDLLAPDMTLNVKTPDGKNITVDGVKPSDTVQEIKEKIQNQESIPADKQRLVYQRSELKNPNSTMKENSIHDGSTLNMLEPEMQLKVKTLDGKSIVVDKVKPSDSVEEIKDRIQKQEGIPVDKQRLVFKKKELTDPSSTMDANEIEDGSTLEMLETEMQLKVKTPVGKTIFVDGVKSSDKVEDVKNKIKKQEGIPIERQRLVYKGKELTNPKSTMDDNGIEDGSTLELFEPEMQIKVRTPSGKTIFVNKVKPSDSVQDVKMKIKKQEGIPVDKQRLLYRGKELTSPKSTMDDNGIENGSTLDMLEAEMQLKVKTPDGKTIFIDGVKPSDMVQDIKKKVEKQAGVPVEDQRLLFQKKELNNPTSTMDDHGIKDGSTLDLEKHTITIQKPDGKTFSVSIRPKTDTVGDLKKRVENLDGTSEDVQRLLYKGTALENDTKPLSDHGIQHGSTVNMEPMQIQIHALDGTMTRLNVQPSDTIRDVKQMVLQNINDGFITPDDIRLLFQRDELTDESSLKKLNIKHGSILDIGAIEVNVKKSNGDIFKVSVNPSDAVKDLKLKIEKASGTPAEEQNLKFQQQNLNDDAARLRDLGVKHNSTVNLEDMQIKVRTNDGKIFSVPVNPSDTIGKVKKRIEDMKGIPFEDQRLAKDGEALDDDGGKLGEYGIKNGSTLDLSEAVKTMQIIVKKDWDGKEFPLDVVREEGICSVHEKIKDKEGIPTDQQHLVFKNLLLESRGGKTLRDYSIKEGSILKLERMKIFVRTKDGKFTLPNVEPNTSIEKIKELIEQKKKVAPKDQLLTFGNEQLDDNEKTLSDFRIQHKSTINLDKAKDDGPQYDVQMGEWQNSFGYQGGQKKERVGTRKKKGPGTRNSITQYY